MLSMTSQERTARENEAGAQDWENNGNSSLADKGPVKYNRAEPASIQRTARFLPQGM